MGNTPSSLPAGGKPPRYEEKAEPFQLDLFRLHTEFFMHRDLRASKDSTVERLDFEAEENDALARLRTPAFHEFHPSAWVLNIITLDLHIQRLKEKEDEQLETLSSYLLWGPKDTDEKEVIDRHILMLERDLEDIWDQIVICRAMRRLHTENTQKRGRWKSLGCACCEGWLREAWNTADVRPTSR